MQIKRCARCGLLLPKSRFNKDDRYRDGLCSYCKSCSVACSNDSKHRRKVTIPMSENRACSSFLGVHVAERILGAAFKNIIKMPYGNPGYDFICGRGFKVDVKSACRRKNNSRCWGFTVRCNKIADYLLLIAFNNRSDLTPEHVWLIPASMASDKRMLSIHETTIHKWDKYEQSINKVSRCCNAMKEGVEI